MTDVQGRAIEPWLRGEDELAGEDDLGGEANAPAAAGEVWLPVRHAARECGVPERTAFRWAKRRAVSVRRSGKVQLVELGSVRAYAARPARERRAGEGRAAGGEPTTAERVAALEQRVQFLEALFDSLFRQLRDHGLELVWPGHVLAGRPAGRRR